MTVITAHAIAELCVGISVDRAAALIEQYAQMIASEARVDQAARVYSRISVSLESPVADNA